MRSEEELRLWGELGAAVGNPLLWDERLGEFYACRILADGRELVVKPLTFGRARLTVGPAGARWYQDGW